MRRIRIGQLLSPFALLAASVSCTLPTQSDPPIPMVTIANTFVAATSGELTAALDGSATIIPASDPNPREVELVSTVDPTRRVVFHKGLLGSSSFDFAVGKYSLSGLPGFRAVDAYFYLSAAGADSFVATSGSLEIVQSEAGIIRGRFDFTGTSLGAGAASSRSVRLRGTFWAVPQAP